MLKAFNLHIESNFKELLNQPFLVAISGGVDSVVLSYLCHLNNLNYGLAHCNFQLRGNESDIDERFVKDLAEQFSIDIFSKQFDTKQFAKTHKRSIQMAAREQRYQWFEALTKNTKYKYILTAHHADDNLETFLINFTRGTGLFGLTGIPEKQKQIRRPLLPFSSEDILYFAKGNNIQWREDSSNKSVKYLRNKLRHEVIPILKDINPKLIVSFKKTNAFLNDTSFLIEREINRFSKKALISKENGVTKYKVSTFLKSKNPSAYLYEIFKNYGFTQWEDIFQLLKAESGKQVFSKSHRLVKHRSTLLLSKIKNEQSVNLAVTRDTKKLQIPEGEITFKQVINVKSNTKNCIYIDFNKIEFPLKIRPWSTKDIICPVGMTGKKKVSKLLKDEKLSIIEKENTLVLTSENNIVWVIDQRVDRRFLGNSKSNNYLKIKFSKS